MKITVYKKKSSKMPNSLVQRTVAENLGERFEDIVVVDEEAMNNIDWVIGIHSHTSFSESQRIDTIAITALNVTEKWYRMSDSYLEDLANGLTTW